MINRIRQLREDAGLSQNDLANKMQMTAAAISAMERGKVSITNKNVNLYCEIFHVTETWLRTGEGEKRSLAEDDLAQVLVDRYHLDNVGLAMLRTWEELDEPQRKLLSYVLERLALHISGMTEEEVVQDAINRFRDDTRDKQA